MKMNGDVIKQQISNLLLQFPELADDDVLRTDMLEGSTDLNEFLRELERRRQLSVGLAAGIELTISNLQQRKNRFERRDDAIRTLMFKMLEWANLKSVELPEATMTVRAGTPKVIVTDEAALSKNYVRIKREPDKIKIGDALKKGMKVKGAELSNVEPVLAIRVK